MKKIIIATIVVLFGINLNSQTILNPEPLKFNFTDYQGAYHQNTPLQYQYFPQEKFIVGWQWGQHPRLTSELKSNMYQTTYFKNELDDINSTYVAPNRIYTVMGIAYDIPKDAQSFMYEPTLHIPYDQRGDFITREQDPNNPIFGFSHIRGRIIEDPTDENYSRLMIDLDSLKGEVILTNAWKIDELFNNSF